MTARRVAIVASAQAAGSTGTNLTPVELLTPVVHGALAAAGLDRKDVGFWCHGSCDYMSGQPFSFVSAVDALGAWPPIVESHVEADGAFALYEAWLKILTGDCDTALVFANGKSSSGPIADVMALQLDPYTVAPLRPDMHAIAGLGARACLDAGVVDERSMAEVAARSLGDAAGNPTMVRAETVTADELLSRPYTYVPLRDHDCPPVTDGACAVVLAVDDVARSLTDRPAWITGLDHRIDTQNLGQRDLTTATSARLAGERVGAGSDRLDVAELHAPFSYQELLLAQALGIDATRTRINPSGGALCGNPQMAAGLARFVEAAERVIAGEADRALAHCTSGPCLQQNLVGIMEGE
jgi:acetyl-CoA acetyltransferase